MLIEKLISLITFLSPLKIIGAFKIRGKILRKHEQKFRDEES